MTTGPGVSAAVERWPLVGRADIARRAVELLRRSSAVVVTGEAGLGKSRLARMVLDRCGTGGALVARTAATASPVASPAVAALLTDAGAGSSLAEAPSVAAAARALRALAGGRPTVLGVDDADRLTPADAALVHELAERTGAGLLLTARPDAGAGPPWWQRRPVVELPLRPLPLRATAALLTAALGGPVDGMTVRGLWRAARGNPLVLHRLVGVGLTCGRLVAVRDVWSWRGAVGDPRRWRDLAAVDAEPLPDGVSEVLEYLAVAGPLPEAVLRAVVAGPALDALVSAGRVVRTTGAAGTVLRPAHPLQVEGVLPSVGSLRRRRLFRDLVRAADPADGDRPKGPLQAWWRLEAAEPVPPATLLAAAGAALGTGRPGLAARLARHVPGRDGALLHAEALVALGRAGEAERILCRLCLDRPDDPRAAATRVLNLFWGLSRTDEAAAEVERARQHVPRPDGSVELTIAAQAVALFTGGAGAPVDARGGGPLIRDVAEALRTYLLTFRGRPGQVCAERDPEPAPAVWTAVRMSTRACQAYALVLTGRLGEGLALARRHYAGALRRSCVEEAAVAAHAVGVAEWWSGRPARALPALREAYALADERTPFPVRVFIAGQYAVCLAALGEADRAGRILAAIDDRVAPGSTLCDRVELDRVLVLAYGGRHAHAADRADRLAERYLAAGRLTTGVECAYLHVRLAPARSAAAVRRLRDAAARCDSPLFDLFAEHAEALLRGRAAPLLRVADRFDALGYHGFALEAAAAAAHGPAAPAAANRARQRAGERCAGHAPPWLPSPTASARLTAREREVCELAAAGLRNGEIAQRLGISVRTVGNLLQLSYTKLAIGSRRHLAERLALAPLAAGGG
uniref:Putative LuxR transcriptional regulator n=1 Tax=Dactylosporangium aurantiacum subsp. hamdenensis TaxID=703577 RepID=E9LIQ9_9ACTN|nr:putative LuxR transcriptional regulator [Dactylosporangium aurantiacum subsp. hamdenensis]